jgi:hypothetical protein
MQAFVVSGFSRTRQVRLKADTTDGFARARDAGFAIRD